MYDMIRECGATAWIGVLLAIIALVLGLVGAALLASKKAGAARVLAVVTLVFVAAILALGPAGRASARSMVEGAVSGESVTPEQRTRILAEGYREAEQCVPVSLVSSALPLLVGVGVLVGAVAARRRARAA